MPLGTHVEVRHLFARLSGQLRSREHDHSEVVELNVGLLGERPPQIGGMVVSYGDCGVGLERTVASYRLRHGDGEWRFVTAMAHPVAVPGG